MGERVIRPMKDFQNYLLNKHLSSEKSAPYCVSWVSKCYAFADKDIGASLSSGEVDAFLRSLTRSCEDWQVNQAKEAISLYQYYLRTRRSGDDASGQNPTTAAGGTFPGGGAAVV